MRKLGLKVLTLLFCCNMTVGMLPIQGHAVSNGSEALSESVETWMPDQNLRKAVAYYLGGINPDDITKEAMANLDMLTFDQYTLDIPENTVVDFTGLEYSGELLTFDSTYVIAENVPTIKVGDQSLVYVMPNVLKKLEVSGRVAQLQIGRRYGTGVPTSELINLGDYIHRLNPTDYLRVFSEDMADFSSIGIQSDVLTDTYMAEFVSELQLLLPNLEVLEGHTGEVLYEQDVLKDFMGNSLLSASTHSAPGMIRYLDENKDDVYHYSNVDYTDKGMVFDELSDDVAYVLVEFARLPTLRSAGVNELANSNTRSLVNSMYSLSALIPVVRVRPGADVTVRYHDEDGKTIADEERLTGNVGAGYVSEQKVIDGHTFKEVQGEPTGTFTDQPQTVTYVYSKNQINAGDVKVKYQDTEGKTIADDERLTGVVGDSYVSEQKTIDGYTFKDVQGNPTGLFTDQPQTVTYVYSKNPLNVGTVTVKYQDTKGNKIAEEEKLTGNIGSAYVSEQKAINGYTFKEVQGNPTGVFTNEAQTVIYVYTQTQVPVKTNDITAKYQDENGKSISEDVIIKGTIGEDYATEQKKIDGYTFKEVRGNPTGKFTDQPQTVVYVYKKNVAANVDTTPTSENHITTFFNKVTGENTSGKSLPKTGEDTKYSQAFTIIGIALIFSTGIYLLGFRNKRGNHHR